MSVRQVIMEEMVRIAEQQKKNLVALSDTVPLLDTGFDSLCIAMLVAALDDRLGIDPFGREGDQPIPVTVGDFVKLYENEPV
jgi:hypothetical protein